MHDRQLSTQQRPSLKPGGVLRGVPTVEIERVLADRAAPAWIIDEVAALLGHYFERERTPQELGRLAMDFAEDLRVFSRHAVGHAISEWRRTSHRRPSPGELVILAERETARLAAEIRARRPIQDSPAPPERTPEELTRVRAIYEAYRKRVELPPEPDRLKPKRLHEPTAEEVEAARSANPIVQSIRAEQARKRKEAAA